MDKKEFRKICKNKLLKTKKINYIYIDKKISNTIKQYILKNKQRRILVYIPLDFEVNIFDLIFWLKKNKYKVFTPLIIKESFKITPFRLPLRKNKYNIYETSNSNFISFNKIDLAIVPVLGIDRSMRRIGFGKGMYDRFYEKLRKKPITIFTSRFINYYSNIITNNYDIKGDVIVSSNSRRKDVNSITNTYKYNNYNDTSIFNSKKCLYIKTK